MCFDVMVKQFLFHFDRTQEHKILEMSCVTYIVIIQQKLHICDVISFVMNIIKMVEIQKFI